MTKGEQTILRLVLTGEKRRMNEDILSKYEWVDDCYFYDERARVMLNGKEGYVDTDGNVIGAIKYDNTNIFSEGFAGVCIGDKWGFINKQGEEICPFIYDEVRYFQSGRVAVCREGLWGFINEQGEEVIPCIFDDKIIPIVKNISEREWQAALQRIEEQKNRMTSQMFLTKPVPTYAEVMLKLMELGLSTKSETEGRYCRPIATKADWKTEPVPERTASFKLHLPLSYEELVSLGHGFVPWNMDQKWFYYYESGKLFFHRSWTGYCYYVITLDLKEF